MSSLTAAAAAAAAATASIPIQSKHVTFENLNYSVPLRRKGQSLTILDDLSGCFVPGKLTVLMGKSGAGKTTLLDLLAGRKNTGKATGTILYGGKVPTVTAQRSLVGYVEQFDTLVAELTVEQMLQYTAALMLPRQTTAAQRQARVKEVVHMLDLKSCRNTTIGNALRRGISGGQAKRVNIGLALIPRPPILLLDEPTSGLDSRTAAEVVVLLKQLAAQGRTIVCTLHAPSGHAFELFDDLHMMEDGKFIYQGPVQQVQEYFEALGFARDPVASLPEWLVDLTSDMNRIYASSLTEKQQETNASFDFVAAYKDSQIKKQVDHERIEILKAQQQSPTQESINGLDKSKSSNDLQQLTPPSELSRLWTLIRFRTVSHYQQMEFIGPRFGDKAIFSLLFMSLYFRMGKQVDPKSVASIASLFFFIVAKCSFGAASFVPTLALERQLYYRELNDGAYLPATYYTAKFVEEAFIALFTSTVFTTVVFFGCELCGNFGMFFVAYYLTTLVGVILAYFFASFFSSISAANAWLPTYVTINLYFSGFVILTDKIPPGWQWFTWTSFMRYSWGALMVNNFKDSEPGRASVYFDAQGNAQTVLDFYGMADGSVMSSAGACLGLLTAVLGFFTVIGILSLVYIRHDKR